MKRVWVSMLLALSVGTVAMAQDQDVDNRPASKKAQDVYVEPTLRMTTTTTTTAVDPKTSQSQVISEQKQVDVFNHQGQLVSSSDGNGGQVAAPIATQSAAVVQPATQTGAMPSTGMPSSGAQSSKITDMSRPAQ